MRLGILSDTHDKLDRTIQAVALLREAGVDALVHCGDLTGPAIVEACAVLPCWFVYGNNDADSVPALRRAAAEFGPTCLEWGGIFEWGGKRIGVVHGHLGSDVRRVLSAQPHFLLTGHSHQRGDTMAGPVRRINPGALHRAAEFSAAILNVETGGLQWLSIAR